MGRLINSIKKKKKKKKKLHKRHLYFSAKRKTITNS